MFELEFVAAVFSFYKRPSNCRRFANHGGKAYTAHRHRVKQKNQHLLSSEVSVAGVLPIMALNRTAHCHRIKQKVNTYFRLR
jgi:hypothetical protein